MGCAAPQSAAEVARARQQIEDRVLNACGMHRARFDAEDASGSPPPVGALEEFWLGEQKGGGAFGNVYRATRTTALGTEQRGVVKETKVPGGPYGLERNVRLRAIEASVGAAVRHPNVARILAVDVRPGGVRLVCCRRSTQKGPDGQPQVVTEEREVVGQWSAVRPVLGQWRTVAMRADGLHTEEMYEVPPPQPGALASSVICDWTFRLFQCEYLCALPPSGCLQRRARMHSTPRWAPSCT